MATLRFTSIVVILLTLTGCSVIGGGSGDRYDGADKDTCDIRVENEGSFFFGHHIVGLTGPRDLPPQSLKYIAVYLEEEGYEIRATSSSKRIVGVFLSNGKQYQMSVTMEEHSSEQKRLELRFTTPPLIGLMTAHVKEEFCRIDAVGKGGLTKN